MLMKVTNPNIVGSSRRPYDIGAALFMVIFTLIFGFTLVVTLAHPLPPESFFEEIELGL